MLNSLELGPFAKSRDKKDLPSARGGHMSIQEMLSGKKGGLEKKARPPKKAEPESAPEQDTQNSQITDIDMSDIGTLPETQDTESNDWEETQLVETETQPVEIETQVRLSDSERARANSYTGDPVSRRIEVTSLVFISSLP